MRRTVCARSRTARRACIRTGPCVSPVFPSRSTGVTARLVSRGECDPPQFCTLLAYWIRTDSDGRWLTGSGTLDDSGTPGYRRHGSNHKKSRPCFVTKSVRFGRTELSISQICAESRDLQSGHGFRACSFKKKGEKLNFHQKMKVATLF